MSLTFGFYNSINGDRTYDAIQFGQIFDGIITDGIYATYLKAMVVKASDNPSEVIVQPGRAWFNHTWTYIDADYPVEAPAPEVILDRVDTLVLDVNTENASRANSLVWVQGTPASVNPEAPTLINTTTHHQYPLCNVYRKAGTTMIYAADITNRVGTSATPFVTGVLTGINIDDLLSQWDDEFHTWENATKTSFEGWMVNQQSVYTTWFNSIRTQMAGDLDEFEAWFETIRGIIDEEAATHLQAEIDELKDMLPAGSHIDISTNESTLFNRNVTVSDGVHSKTVQFNAVGGATVESFPYIGAISVTSTDGERTASEVINIPYFGRYSVVLAFWSATVNLVGDSALGGVPVTVKDSDDLTITTIVLDASGRGTFIATKPDTYKFTYTYGGQTMETTLQVTQETTYEVEIHGGFNYQAWLNAGRVSKSFSSLDEVLEDEKTLRQLFLVHDAVDYVASQRVNNDLTKIFNTDLAAKWINNSDYALDHFYAVPDIKTVMDAADKYGYGEWVINNGTWGPKGNVPIMTANNAPYGEASASSFLQSGYEAYKAFDGDESTAWVGKTANSTIQYKFTNPICVKRVKVRNANGSNRPFTAIVKASNDGTTWESLTESFSVDMTNDYISVDINNNDYYLYLMLDTTATLGNGALITALQFYGRELKVSVPTMTSNTAPYGEASASSEYSGGAYPAWKAFDGDRTKNGWFPSSNTDQWISYQFTRGIVPKMMTAVTRGGSFSNVILHGGNNGDFTPLTTAQSVTSTLLALAIQNTTNYDTLKVSCDVSQASGNYGIWLQFYGLDYSEKEFEVGTTKKWLYDHGVELVGITAYKANASNTAEKENNQLYLKGAVSSSIYGFRTASKLDLTAYSLIRTKVGNKGGTASRLYFMGVVNNITDAHSSAVAEGTADIANAPNNESLSISSVNGSYYPVLRETNGDSSNIGSISEWWLE